MIVKKIPIKESTFIKIKESSDLLLKIKIKQMLLFDKR